MKSDAMPGFFENPEWRIGSPSGASILITSAPMSPRICVASGPSTLIVRSRTRMPLRGPLISWSALSRFLLALDHAQWRVHECHGAVLLHHAIAGTHES